MKKDTIKDRILTTTESLFKDNHYEDISIRQIVSLSGISIGAFYRYINSKEELLEYLSVKFNQEIQDSLLKQTKNKNSLEKIYTFFDIYINRIIKYNYKYSCSFISLELEKQSMIFSSGVLTHLKKYVKEAYDNSYFSKKYPEDQIFSTFSSFFMGTVLNWCFSTGKSDLKHDFFKTFNILIDKFKVES